MFISIVKILLTLYVRGGSVKDYLLQLLAKQRGEKIKDDTGSVADRLFN